MSNIWYASSVAYAAIAQFAISHAYSIGDIVRSLASPTNGNRGTFRCTTAGTSGGSETTWGQNNGATTTQGTAVFTCISGNSTYGWTGAAGDVTTVSNAGGGSGYAASGDTIYLSSDHSESTSGVTLFGGFSGTWSATVFVISVNRGGSVPPVAGDITAGALITASSSTLLIDSVLPTYVNGVTFAVTNSSLVFSSNGNKGVYLKNCALQLNGNNAGFVIESGNPAKVTWDNTTLQFANASQGIVCANGSKFEIEWINTPSAIQGATIPTNLFKVTNTGHLVTCRGVDLSAVTTTLVQAQSANQGGASILFDSCKIASGVAPYGTGFTGQGDSVELVNCYDGTNTRNERYSSAGKVTSERTITLTGGATDDIGTFSEKYVSNATGVDKWAFPLEGFWLDCEWNGTLGSARTATVEIISSASLNNDDVSLLLEYQGTSSSPVASFVDTKPATPLTADAAITSSSATWNSSPATPQAQKLQATFTPQVAGRVRARVRLGKISTTVYVNPVITIT